MTQVSEPPILLPGWNRSYRWRRSPPPEQCQRGCAPLLLLPRREGALINKNGHVHLLPDMAVFVFRGGCVVGKFDLGPAYWMMHRIPTSAPQDAAKNVTKSIRVSPRDCGTRFFNAFGRVAASDKNDRFWQRSSVMGFLSASSRSDKMQLTTGLSPL